MKTTCKDICRELSRYPDSLPVVVTTKDYSPEGYPEWDGFHVRHNEELNRLEIVLTSLTDDCLPDDNATLAT